MGPVAFRLSTTLLAVGLAVTSAGVAAAQTVPTEEAPAAPPTVRAAPVTAGQPPGLHVDFTVMNAFDGKYRPQLYQGLIRTPDGLARRRDRRILTSATYQRPVTTRVSLLALAGFQRRWSNDLSRRLAEPTVALSLRYRWR